MSVERMDHIFKVLLIGDAGVGKSSILLQFTDGSFNENLQSTIGVDFKIKTLSVESQGGRDVVKVLVGNKIDQPVKVKPQMAEAWAQGQGMIYMSASAKTKQGIKDLFYEVIAKILEKPELLVNTKPNSRASDISNPTPNTSSKGCC